MKSSFITISSLSSVIIIEITSSLSHNDINIIGGFFKILTYEPWAIKQTSRFKMSSTVTSHEKGYCTKCEWMITKVIMKFHDQRHPPKSEQAFSLLQVLLSSVYSDSQKPSYRFNFLVAAFCVSIPKFTVASKGLIHDNNSESWVMRSEVYSSMAILLNHWAHTYIQR